MSTASEGLGITFFVLVAVVGAGLAANGTFYPTGKQFYEACWEKHVKEQQVTREPQTDDPHKDLLWRNCEVIALRAAFAEGMMLPIMPVPGSNCVH